MVAPPRKGCKTSISSSSLDAASKFFKMRTIRLGLSSALFLLLARAGEPCSCDPSGLDFWRLADKAQVVVAAQVTRHLSVSSPADWAFEARVIAVVKGTEAPTTLTFQVPMADTCSVGLRPFPVGSIHAFILPVQGAFSQCQRLWIPLDENLTIEQVRAKLAGLPMPPPLDLMVPPPPLPPTPTPTPRPPTPAYGVIRPNTGERGGGPCPCKPEDLDFWQMARRGPVVVVAQVTRQLTSTPAAQWAFEARVIATVKGTEARATLTLPAAPNGSPCAETALSFPVGSTYAFVLSPGDPPGFRHCQPRWLRLEGAKNDPNNVALEIDQLRAFLTQRPSP